MEKTQEISKEMEEAKEDNLDIATPSSENNFLLEKYLYDSTSAEKLTYPNTTTVESTVRYKRKENVEDQVPNKKLRDNTDLNLSEELMQVSATEENPSMNISKESLSEDCDIPDNVEQMNQSEDSEITNINPYVFQSMSAENNPFISETIYLSKGILCFEKTSSSARNKPLVCKTIFVNGLPEKITEGIIKEIFQRCGSIEAIKMAGSESCYVTFSEEISVEFAMRFSGYRLKIDKKNEAAYSGILFIDYAQAEFDHSSLIHSQSASNSQTPSYSDTRFSEYGIEILFEKLKNRSTFHEALYNLAELFKQKERLKKDTDYLFPVMQKIYCHVLFLVDNKEKFELDVTKSKSDLVEYIKGTCKLLVDIENTFKLSQENNNWSYFTKRQRKNIKLFEDHCKEYKSGFMEELSSYENSLNEQKNQPKENIEFCRENTVSNSICNLEDSEGQNQENIEFCGENGISNSICNLEDSEVQNQENSFSPMTSFLAHCTDNAASFICEKLKREETFTQAANTIIIWLEQEECSGENATSFFSMLQCIHNHVIKLQDNKNEYEENFQDAKKTLIKHFKEILYSLTKVERIYLTVSLDECSNHFSVVERKDIEVWEKYANKLKLDIKRKIYELRNKVKAENELKNKVKADKDKENAKFYKELNDSIRKLRDDQNILRSKFQEVKNNIATVKCTFKKDFEHLDKQLAAINKAMRKSQKRILKLKARCFVNEIELRELRSSVYRHNIGDELQADSSVLTQDEARVISLVSIFLNIRPGASIDSIYSYLHGIDTSINCRTVENLMRRFPTMFEEEVTVIGTNFQRKWYLISIS